MKKVTLFRGPSTPHGTFGRLGSWHTIELPWNNDVPNASCIRAGIYKCIWRLSPRFGWCYIVTNVPGRQYILIHPANYAGDVARGFKSDLLGCIGLGKSQAVVNGQRMLLSSRQAILEFHALMNKNPFLLEIKNERYSNTKN